MSWERQLDRNEIARQSAAIRQVAERLGELTSTVEDTNDLRRQLAELKIEMGKAQDLIGAAYGLLRRAREEEAREQGDLVNIITGEVVHTGGEI